MKRVARRAQSWATASTDGALATVRVLNEAKQADATACTLFATREEPANANPYSALAEDLSLIDRTEALTGNIFGP